MADLIGGEGLRKVVEGAAFHRIDGALEGSQRGDDDYRSAGLPPSDIGDGVQPGVLTQPDVDQYEVERAAFECLQCGGRTPHTENPRPVSLQAQTKRLTNAWIIVYHQGRPALGFHHHREYPL